MFLSIFLLCSCFQEELFKWSLTEFYDWWWISCISFFPCGVVPLSLYKTQWNVCNNSLAQRSEDQHKIKARNEANINKHTHTHTHTHTHIATTVFAFLLFSLYFLYSFISSIVIGAFLSFPSKQRKARCPAQPSLGRACMQLFPCILWACASSLAYPNLPILVYLVCLTLPKVSFFFYIFQIIYKFTMQVPCSQLPSII